MGKTYRRIREVVRERMKCKIKIKAKVKRKTKNEPTITNNNRADTNSCNHLGRSDMEEEKEINSPTK